MAKKAEVKTLIRPSATLSRPTGEDKSGRPSSFLDTRVIYCGDNLEQLAKLPGSANSQLMRQKRVPKLAGGTS